MKESKQKRERLTEEMLAQQIENLQKSRTTMAAVAKTGVSYPTFLARFRRIGLSVESVQKLLDKGDTPKQIAADVFRKKAKHLQREAPTLKAPVQKRLRVSFNAAFSHLRNVEQILKSEHVLPSTA